MASLTWDRSRGNSGGKLARIQFMVGDRRQAIRLGRVPVRVARTWLARVEQLVACRVGGVAHDADLAGWLRDLPAVAYQKLSLAGLAPEREEFADVTLAALCDAFTARAAVKPSTAAAYGQTLDSLKNFYGPERPISTITAESADAWRMAISTDTQGTSRRKKKRTGDGNRLAPATVAKRTHVAKQLFGKAVRWSWLASNPFAALRAGSQVNVSRSAYVHQETIEAVLKVCPGVEWRLVVGLCRFAGLRCPSEVARLTWDDVDLERGRLTVRATKTEHHGRQHAVRIVPILPWLRRILADARLQSEPAEPLVVPMAGRRGAGANFRTQLGAIIEKAGHKQWPRLFQNLRASFETDLVEKFPAQVAAKWLGHSPMVAAQHYLQTRDHHFEAAVRWELDEAPAGGAESGAREAQIAAQQPSVTGSNSSQLAPKNGTIPGQNIVSPGDRVELRKSSMGSTGFEPVTSTV
jgi:integrase